MGLRKMKKQADKILGKKAKETLKITQLDDNENIIKIEKYIIESDYLSISLE